jgi:hypothetical protein
MKKVQSHYLADIVVGEQQKTNPVIMRIILSDQFTRIDFGYSAPWIYVRGGWIRIAQHTYIEVQGSQKKYELIEAKNIPLAPEKFEFESKEDWRVFSLYFKPIPLKSCVIDIIEEEQPDEKDFNFYGVSVNVDQNRVVEYG